MLVVPRILLKWRVNVYFQERALNDGDPAGIVGLAFLRSSGIAALVHLAPACPKS